ncbi:MAG TPA: SIS domain-containing protein [Desulfobacterales bacterium]|nr:SIS domain-containing protein [Desulfobacterales bacterium]
MDELVIKVLEESLEVVERFIRHCQDKLVFLAQRVADAFVRERKLMICGNGGSAADAQHMAAEFVNRFQLERPPLPALALTTDTSVITSIANDYEFSQVFSKQVKALGLEGDVLLGISTSGNSENIVSAVREAKKMGIFTAGFLGNGGGKLLDMVDIALVVESDKTPRVQEAHALAGHILCRLVDYILFQSHVTSSSKATP